jgi:hypothetical protein
VKRALLDYLLAIVLGMCLAVAMVAGLADERGDVPVPVVVEVDQ